MFLLCSALTFDAIAASLIAFIKQFEIILPHSFHGIIAFRRRRRRCRVQYWLYFLIAMRRLATIQTISHITFHFTEIFFFLIFEKKKKLKEVREI
jgi:hypothetical protein